MERKNDEPRLKNTARTDTQRVHRELKEKAFEQAENPKADEYSRDNVKDFEAFEAYTKLRQNPVLNEGRFYTNENGECLKISMNRKTLLKKIVDWSPEDRRKALKKNKIFFKVLGKANAKKRKAFGTEYKEGRRGNLVRDQMNMLSERHEAEVIELFGRMFSPKEVHKYVVEELEVKCSLGTVLAFRKYHIDTISQKIEHFKRNFSEIRLGHKKGRLEELVWLYQRAKNILQSTGRDSDRDFMLKVLEQLRKECEGDRIQIDGNLDIKMEANINMHVRKEVLQDVNLNQIILGRVASRMGVPASKIIKNMMDSYYDSFNGLISTKDEDTLDAEYEVMDYPSAEAYDFSTIKRRTKKLDEQEKAEDDALKSSIDKHSKLARQQGFKEILLGKINERKQKINAKTMQVQQATIDREITKAEAENKKDVDNAEQILKRKTETVKNKIAEKKARSKRAFKKKQRRKNKK